jgi:hypothetical protein
MMSQAVNPRSSSLSFGLLINPLIEIQTQLREFVNKTRDPSDAIPAQERYPVSLTIAHKLNGPF